ncbi:hypothetical protein EDC01DRAFT_421884 [Geopyxis carbonaria]|nr:hypothetical protein EDC01DRAFT_421884 [Geopyxis carbonaria]
MAAIPSHATYTPPSSSLSGRNISGKGDWDYSVPIDGRDDLNNKSQERRNDGMRNQENKPAIASSIKRDPNSSAISQKINGYHSPPNTNEEYVIRSASHSLEDDTDISGDYLVAPKAPLLTRRDSTVSSNHDGDSVFDLYGGRMSVVSGYDVPLPTGGIEGYTNGNISNAPGQSENKDPESQWIDRDKLAKIEGNEAEDYLFVLKKSRWIHKDKLERIEIEELQQIGINPPPLPQTSPIHVDENENENEELTKTKQLMPSPTLSDEGGHAADDDPPDFDFDIRTPEERAADNKSADSSPRAIPHKQFHRNPSYSRIPVASISPHPIPQQYIERSTPLPRNAVTPNGSDDGRASISLPGARKRSYSAGSALLLDDSTATGTPNPGNAINNPKNYSRNPMSPTAGGRRSIASRTGSMAGKQRTRSNPQLHRPGTSASYATHNSGGTQGSAGKQPEGPPPWALQAYKPDPSLPPDQQIIPTLAKRLQQEQWERDGLYASVYDRELRPLQVHDNNSTEKGTQGDSTEPKEEWPLKNTGPAFLPEPKPKEEPTPDGGYSTMPNVNGQAPTDSPPRVVQKVPQVDDEKEKKRKFCCCVIM